jgi:hypothetical protein
MVAAVHPWEPRVLEGALSMSDPNGPPAPYR